MSSASTPTARFFGQDPGRMIRCWVAGFVRVGIGLSMLGSGLRGYFAQQNVGFRNGLSGIGSLGGALDPLFLALPYFSIALGVALLVGFLTTAAAIGAAFLSLLPSVLLIIEVIARFGMPMGGGFGRFGGDPFESMFLTLSLSQMLPYAVMIWLSPLENNPISFDALIFGRNTVSRIRPPSVETTVGPDLSSTIDPVAIQSSE
jgi:flagellar biosynthesis protein FliQ